MFNKLTIECIYLKRHKMPLLVNSLLFLTMKNKYKNFKLKDFCKNCNIIIPHKLEFNWKLMRLSSNAFIYILNKRVV